MQQRKLGQQGLSVSAIGLGTMGMTMAYGPSDEAEGIATIQKAYDLGVTFYDTAELYGMGNGSNEILVGKAVAAFRQKVVIATKFGFDLTNNQVSGVNSRPENIRKVCDNSLRYLGTDYLDIFYQHRVDPTVPMADVAGAVKDLITAGKVRYFGLSEAGPKDLRAAHAVQPVSVLQTEYSLFERAVESDVLPVVRELGIGFVPYSPLGRGFLTGDVKPASEYPAGDMRTFDPRWQGDNYTKNARALGQLAELAAGKKITVPQLALAWLLAQGDDIAPIPGTRNAKRLAENLGAADVVLSAADIARVREILPTGAFGARYAEGWMPTWH